MTLKSYKGRQRFDARIHYQDDGGEWQPTKKGINLSVDDLPALRRLIVDAERQAIKAGLINPLDHDEA